MTGFLLDFHSESEKLSDQFEGHLKLLWSLLLRPQFTPTIQMWKFFLQKKLEKFSRTGQSKEIKVSKCNDSFNPIKLSSTINHSYLKEKKVFWITIIEYFKVNFSDISLQKKFFFLVIILIIANNFHKFIHSCLSVKSVK